jgi:HAMP domain-containing protein
MAPWDVFTAPLRSLLGVAEQTEQQVVSHTPLHETAELEAKLEGCMTAIHRSTDSLEQHIAVLEKLADSLAPLTQSVTRLTDQLEPLLQLAKPLGAAEQHVASAEHEISRVGHLFGRHHRDAEPPAPPAAG